MAKFVDRVKITVIAGKGGQGCNSVHREKFKPLGGPDGGNGGSGGSIILQASTELHTLLDFHFKTYFKAANGKPGQGNHSNGATAKDVILNVPVGTVIFDDSGKLLADLSANKQMFIAAQGGRGGLGNAALASSRRKVPGFALLGEQGEERTLILELKSMADVGLVGFPSAGKSSLVSVVSKAKPTIADYPFTTLTPHLGVVEAGAIVYTIADVPGLIPGASHGKGLGFEFLRHIERCAVIVHVVDTAVLDSARNPVNDIQALENELKLYEKNQADHWAMELKSKPRVIVLNKMDSKDAQEMAEIQEAELKNFGWPIYPVSTLTKQGLAEFTFALGKIVEEHRQKFPTIVKQNTVLRIIEPEDDSFTIKKDPLVPNGYVVEGKKPERWIQQTQFDNEEAVGFLADRLAKLGVEEKLLSMGASPGDFVRIGEYSFEWEPDINAGDTVLLTERGKDMRLENNKRVTAAERKLLRKERRNISTE